MLKTFTLVLVATILGGTGHVLLAKGMRSVGDLTEAGGDRVVAMIGRAIGSPWLLIGVALQAAFFLMLLSRADVSLVLPMTAIDYVTVVVLAGALLGEPVTAARWAGIALIVGGVFLVSRS